VQPIAHFNLVAPFLMAHPTARLCTAIERKPTREVFLQWSANDNCFLLDLPTSRSTSQMAEDQNILDCAFDVTRANRAAKRLHISASRIDEAMAHVYTYNRRLLMPARAKKWLDQELQTRPAENHSAYLRRLADQRRNANAAQVTSSVGP
jgi:hypothetical protein